VSRTRHPRGRVGRGRAQERRCWRRIVQTIRRRRMERDAGLELPDDLKHLRGYYFRWVVSK